MHDSLRASNRSCGARDGPEGGYDQWGYDQYGYPSPKDQGGQETGRGAKPEPHRRGRGQVLARIRGVPEGPSAD